MRTFNRAQLVLVGVGMAVAVLYVLLPYRLASELVMYCGTVGLALVGSIIGVRRSWHTRRLPWLLSSIAIGLWLAGELVWWTLTQQGKEPFPSPGDFLFLVGYLPLCVAAYAFTRSDEKEGDRAAWLDAGILTFVVGLLMWDQLIAPYAADATISGLEKVITLTYPLADVLVIGFLLRLVFTRGARTQATILFTAGVLAMLGADVAFSYLSLRGLFETGSWVDICYLGSYLLIAAASLDDTADRKPDDALSLGLGLGRGRLVLVLGSVLVPPMVLLFELRSSGQLNTGTLTVAVGVSMIVSVLVSFRLWSLLGHARELETRRGSQRLSSLIHHSLDSILLVDRDGFIAYGSPSLRDTWGYDPIGSLGHSFIEWVDHQDKSRVVQLIREAAESKPGSVFDLQCNVFANGHQSRVVEGSVCNLLEDDNVQALVLTIRDITTRRLLEQQLEQRAFHDDLTGLANRALFTNRVGYAIARSTRMRDLSIAVLFVDLDDFKAINDGMGHNAGDDLLRQVAERLRSSLRPGDTIARLGGDEFAVLLEDLPDVEYALALAQRIVAKLLDPVNVQGLEFGVPASVGLAMQTPDCSVETLLRDADIAMYRAKSEGKSRVVVFDDSLRDDARRHLELRVELPGALVGGQFRLVYQPIHNVRGQSLYGFEALARWDHPVRGVIAPLEFIPIAEESGFIVELGRWILREACQQAMSWNLRTGLPLSMSVNASAIQVKQPLFVQDIKNVLLETGLAPNLLTIELTESVLVEYERVESVLSELRELGVGVAIDDFGTGYSSLQYLQRFPVSSVKIDRAFVNELSSLRDPGLVRSIVALAESLGLMTVAEGVETEDQLGVIGSLNCTLVQGYFLGRPQSPNEVEHLLDRLPKVVHVNN